LRVRIDALENSLRADMATKNDMALMKSDMALMKSDMASMKGDMTLMKSDMVSLKGDMVSMKSDMSSMKSDMVSLKSDLASTKAELRSEMRAGFADAKRYTDVLFESLKDDIRIVADGVATITAKLDKRV